MLEKLYCIRSKRATRLIYMEVQVWPNAINLNQSQQSSVTIGDLNVSGYTNHHRLRPIKASPSPAIKDIMVSCYMWRHHLSPCKTQSLTIPGSSPADTCTCNTPHLAIHSGARSEWNRCNNVIPIVTSAKPCESEQKQYTTVAWGWPSVDQQTNPRIQKKSETISKPTCNQPSMMVELLLMACSRCERVPMIRHWWELPLLTDHPVEIWLPAYFVAIVDHQSYTAYLSIMPESQKVVILTMYLSVLVLVRAGVLCFRKVHWIPS